MSTAEIFKELESLARTERAGVIKRILQGLCADSKAVERIMRRVENPDVPADVWRGIEDVEDGRVVDMEAALHEKLPSAILPLKINRRFGLAVEIQLAQYVTFIFTLDGRLPRGEESFFVLGTKYSHFRYSL